MKLFCGKNNLKILIKHPTCYKTPDNRTYIRLIITNEPRSLYSTFVPETGLSELHLMAFAITRKKFKQSQPKRIFK